MSKILITPDAHQQLVARTYCNGEFEHFAEPYHQADLDDVGDSLFIFLMSECSMGQDADSPETVLNRLETMRYQINDVEDAFERLL